MLADLKNYIDLKNDALATRLKKEVGGELSTKIDEKTDEILEAIGDSVLPRIESCETRLVKLETVAA